MPDNTNIVGVDKQLFLDNLREQNPEKYAYYPDDILFNYAISENTDLQKVKWLDNVNAESPGFFTALGYSTAQMFYELPKTMQATVNIIESTFDDRKPTIDYERGIVTSTYKQRATERLKAYNDASEKVKKATQDNSGLQSYLNWVGQSPWDWSEALSDPSYFGRAMGNGLGSYALVLAGSVVGSLAGPAGAFAAGSGIGMVLEAGDMYNQSITTAKQKGYSDKDIDRIVSQASLQYGIIAGILEEYGVSDVAKTLGFGNITRQAMGRYASHYLNSTLEKGSAKEIAERAFANYAKDNLSILKRVAIAGKDISKVMSKEGSTEYFQTMAQEIIHRSEVEKKPITTEFIKKLMASPEAIESAVGGALTGGAFGTISGVSGATGRRGRIVAEQANERIQILKDDFGAKEEHIKPLRDKLIDDVMNSDDYNTADKIAFANTLITDIKQQVTAEETTKETKQPENKQEQTIKKKTKSSEQQAMDMGEAFADDIARNENANAQAEFDAQQKAQAKAGAEAEFKAQQEASVKVGIAIDAIKTKIGKIASKKSEAEQQIIFKEVAKRKTPEQLIELLDQLEANKPITIESAPTTTPETRTLAKPTNVIGERQKALQKRIWALQEKFEPGVSKTTLNGLRNVLLKPKTEKILDGIEEEVNKIEPLLERSTETKVKTKPETISEKDKGIKLKEIKKLNNTELNTELKRLKIDVSDELKTKTGRISFTKKTKPVLQQLVLDAQIKEDAVKKEEVTNATIPEYTIDKTLKNKDGSKRYAQVSKDGNIKLNPVESVGEFYNYITGRTKSITSEQKKRVLSKLKKEGITLAQIKKILNTKKKINTFLILHEQAHIDNNDVKDYYKNGNDLLTKDKIDIETRATKEALNKVEQLPETKKESIKPKQPKSISKKSVQTQEAYNAAMQAQAEAMAGYNPAEEFKKQQEAAAREGYRLQEEAKKKKAEKEKVKNKKSKYGKEKGTEGLQFQLSNKESVRNVNTELNKKLDKVLSKLGIKVERLNKIVSNKNLSIAALTDITNKVIQIANDLESETTLPEEAGHVLFAMLDEAHRKKAMQTIHKWNGYEAVREEYKDVYNTETEIREEAVGKYFAEKIIKKQNLNEQKGLHTFMKRIYDWLINKVSKVFGRDYVYITNSMANDVLNNNIEDYNTIANKEAVFYEVTKDDALEDEQTGDSEKSESDTKTSYYKAMFDMDIPFSLHMQMVEEATKHDNPASYVESLKLLMKKNGWDEENKPLSKQDVKDLYNFFQKNHSKIKVIREVGGTDGVHHLEVIFQNSKPVLRPDSGFNLNTGVKKPDFVNRTPIDNGTIHYINGDAIYMEIEHRNEATNQVTYTDYIPYNKGITKEFLLNIQDQLINRHLQGNKLLVIIGMKPGDSSTIIMDEVPDKFVNIKTMEAFEKYWVNEIKEGNITEKYYNKVIVPAIEKMVEQTEDYSYALMIGRHERMKEYKNNKYLHKDYWRGIDNLFNRMASDLSDGVIYKGLDAEFKKNTGRTQKAMFIPKDTEVEIDGIEGRTQYDDYDGLMLSSISFFKALAEVGGHIDNLSIAKLSMRKRINNGNDYFMIKMSNQTPFPNMKFYRKGENTPFIWTENNGDYFTDGKNKFDHIASDNEVKQRVGEKYQKNETLIDINEKDIRVLFADKNKKVKVPFPYKAVELILDSKMNGKEYDTFINEVKKYYDDIVVKKIDQLFALRDNPEQLYNLIAKELGENESPEEIQKYIQLDKEFNSNKKGVSLFIPTNLPLLLNYINNAFVVKDTYGLRTENGVQLTYNPQPMLGVGRNEMMVSADNAQLVDIVEREMLANEQWLKNKRNENLRLGNELAIDEQLANDNTRIDLLNEYLAENKIELLSSRQPVQKASGVVLLKLTKLIKGNHGNAVFLNAQDVLDVFDGDYDIDKGFFQLLPESFKNAYKDILKKLESENRINTIKLEDFGKKLDEDLTNNTNLDTNDLYESIQKNIKNKGVVGQIVNVMTIMKSLELKDFSITINGKVYNIKSGTDPIVFPLMVQHKRMSSERIEQIYKQGDYLIDSDNKKIEQDKVKDYEGKARVVTSRENALSILLQMAVDDAKFGLLTKMNYDESLLYKIMFNENITPEVQSILKKAVAIFNTNEKKHGRVNGKIQNLNQNISISSMLGDLMQANDKDKLDLIKQYVRIYYKGDIKKTNRELSQINSISFNNKTTPSEEVLLRLGEKWNEFKNKESFNMNPLELYDTEAALTHYYTMSELFDSLYSDKLYKSITEISKARRKEVRDFYKQLDEYFKRILFEKKQPNAKISYDHNQDIQEMIDEYAPAIKKNYSQIEQFIGTMYLLDGYDTIDFKTGEGQRNNKVFKLLPLDLLHKQTIAWYSAMYYAMSKKALKGELKRKSAINIRTDMQTKKPNANVLYNAMILNSDIKKDIC